MTPPDDQGRRARVDGVSSVHRRDWWSRPRLVPFVVLSAMLAVAAMAVAVAVHDLQAGGNAYVAGESRWSKASQYAVFHLDRFAERLDPADLGRARESLEIPLSYRRARLELSSEEPDLARAADLLRAGRSEEAETGRMARLFATFRGWPDFSRALALWSEADVWILRLETLADELEQLAGAPATNPEQIASIRDELALINATLNEKAIAFSRAVTNGNRRLLEIVLWTSVATIGLLVALLTALFIWTMRRVRVSQQRFWNTFEHAPVGMAVIDADAVLLEINDALSRFLDREAENLRGVPLTHFCDQRDRALLRRTIADRETSSHPLFNLESRYVRPDGTQAWGDLSVARLDEQSRKLPLFVAVLEDVSESRNLSAELAYQAAHDQLTGLPNRREFERELNHLLRDMDPEQLHHALGLIDLDQFKVVNDTFGHLAGDALLVRLSERVHSCLREGDVLARLDGDQFGFLLKNCRMGTAQQIAGRLHAEIREFGFSWDERPVNVSASIGLVEIDGECRDPSLLMQRVDLASFEAKDLGRDQVCVHARSRASSMKRREDMDWVNRINEALATDRLRFHGQLIGARSGEAWRCELLVRLEDADGELHTATRFMEAAERYHVARTIDRWVLRHALAVIRRQSRRLPEIEAWHINLSGQSVDCESVLPEIRRMVAELDVDPTLLCFEITESAAIHSLEEARRFFSALQEMGCQVALDDFGKGLSTFDYLKQLPVDLVKIDGGFVRELSHSELDHAMVRSIYEVARVAGKKTIAESVESIELIVRLNQIGIDYLQGHAIHNPEPPDRIAIPDPEESPMAQPPL
ncbi:MAG: putative bifunctional diguanylate cyclase/phosphodiesterase [Candidatus Wenzhouxiangella sp. M2_3B_020]